MALTLKPYNSTDGYVLKTMQGINMFPKGDNYIQYGASATIASSTTETSLLKPASQVPQISGNPNVPSILLPCLPAGSAAYGTIYKGKLVGTIANTGTPNLQIRVVLKNAAGTVVYALADSTAIAMTTVSTSDFEVQFDSQVRAIGTSGTYGSRVNFRYGTTTVYTAYADVTVDTTADYYIDVLLTWGASSASNTATIKWVEFEVS